MATQLGTMVSNVANKLEDPNFEFWTAANIKKTLGDAYRYYVMSLIQSGQGYFETTALLNVIANTETVSIASLSPAFWVVSQFYRKWNNTLIPLERKEGRWDSIQILNGGAGGSWVPKYKIRGTNIVLNPPPGQSETGALQLDYVYIPTFPDSTSANTFTFDANFPTIYEVNVEIRATVKCLESKDAVGGVSDIATFRNELMELDKSFLESLDTDELPDRIEYTGPTFRFL